MHKNVILLLGFVLCCGIVLGAEKELHEPKVVYITLDTPEEVELAQKRILAQYEALGGNTAKPEELLSDLLNSTKPAKSEKSN